MSGKVNIIGAGLAGLSAALTLAEGGMPCRLISPQPSERAQSVLAAGGINAAMNTMGQDDTPEQHAQDTLRSGAGLSDPEAVRLLTERAPRIVRRLTELGVPFYTVNGVLQQRYFGGQKKPRTTFAESSTGKVIMTALIDAVRRYEASGLVERLCRHEFVRLLQDPEGGCAGALIRDVRGGRLLPSAGPVILACGGLNGLFEGRTTGTTANTGEAAAAVFAQGVRFGSLEMIQYHPTTIGIAGKRCLISEAARGEGGRLFVMRNGEPWYFMEEKYPELKNLMPRDVVSRECWFAVHREDCGDQVFLDMRGVSREIWQKKLPDLREEVRHYLGIDPAKEPVPVEPGIHYFMGGIDVDVRHRTNLPGLYAAGECCCQYHGANRLGGNSMLGAICGGMTAAEDILASAKEAAEDNPLSAGGGSAAEGSPVYDGTGASAENGPEPEEETAEATLASACGPDFARGLSDLLYGALGIVREEETMQRAVGIIARLREETECPSERNRLLLGEAMLRSALARRESRGAHARADYPERDEAFTAVMTAEVQGGAVQIGRREVSA